MSVTTAEERKTVGAYTIAPKFCVDDPKVTDFYGRLLRGSAHKLNNQLAVIHGFTSLLMMNEGLSSGDTDNLKHMKEAAENASQLSERVLAAGGCVHISQQEVNMSDFVRMMESSAREPFSKLSVPFEIRKSEDLPTVNVDPSRLKDVIIELLNNAAESASQADGMATMKITPGGELAGGDIDYVEISVFNTGPKIDDASLEEVFHPFVSQKPSQHFGIGLTVASVICTLMGLKLGVKSDDSGTTFAVAIPVAS